MVSGDFYFSAAWSEFVVTVTTATVRVLETIDLLRLLLLLPPLVLLRFRPVGLLLLLQNNELR